MPTYRLPLAVGFTSDLIGHIGYTLFDVQGGLLINRTTSGITANAGGYTAEVDTDAELPLIVRWDSAGEGEAWGKIEDTASSLTTAKIRDAILTRQLAGNYEEEGTVGQLLQLLALIVADLEAEQAQDEIEFF